MATGRLTVTGKLSDAPTRSGVLTKEILTGFEIPGLDLTGCTKNYAITLTNIPSAGSPLINLTSGDVTAAGATVADDGVNHEGRDLGAITAVRMVAVVAPATNQGVITVNSNILFAELKPGGFAVVAMPGGLSGSYLAVPLTIQSEDDGETLQIFSWNS